MRLAVSFAVAISAAAASAQQFTVQQPTFGVTSAATTVSVPDRGEAFIGGFGRSAASRSSFGPLQGRGGIGREASGSTISARVHIHDFEAMDAALLAAPADGSSRPSFAKGRYEDPTAYAMSRREAEIARRPAAIATPAPDDGRSDSARLIALAEAAERRGQAGVATVYYRLAAKNGSGEAVHRLAANAAK